VLYLEYNYVVQDYTLLQIRRALRNSTDRESNRMLGGKH
jgi:hypothetical protein